MQRDRKSSSPTDSARFGKRFGRVSIMRKEDGSVRVARAGLSVEIEQSEWSKLLERVKSDSLTQSEFEKILNSYLWP